MSTKNESEQRIFNSSVRKPDYTKEDKKLYSKIDSSDQNESINNNNNNKTNLDDSLAKNINPIK
jgi:hypothetical protein